MATQILMPALSPTMEEGKLAKWLVKEGDQVRSGDILAEIETDKATMEFEAVDEGRIGKLLVPEGTEGVKVNDPIATLIAEGESQEAPVDIASAMKSIKKSITRDETPGPPADRQRSTIQGRPSQKSPTPQPQPAAAPAKREEDARIFASPLARRLAGQRNVDLAGLRGSGPRGRITRADVEAATASPVAAPAVAAREVVKGVPAVGGIAPLPDARAFFKAGEFEAVPHDTMRKAIARRLTSAKTLIPHFYLTISCRIDNLLNTRARLNHAGKAESEIKLSVNDFVVKAAALALMRVPEVNASWTDDAILRHKHADIGVAVALDFGLITPIVFGADQKGLAVISAEIKALAERARAKKLKPMEFEGGTFAISNLGMYGIESFTAVINPPHAAILAVGTGEKRVVASGESFEVATMMSVTMSCDHRVIDGATGSRFLQIFKQFVEEPAAMLL